MALGDLVKSTLGPKVSNSQPLHEEVTDPSGNEQDSSYVSANGFLRAQADPQNPHQLNNSQ
jgi:hypothetical protein